MKEELRQRLNALRIIEQLPSGEIKDREIRNFVEWMCDHCGHVLPNPGKIRYCELNYSNPEEDIDVTIIIVQTDAGDSITIDADFGDED